MSIKVITHETKWGELALARLKVYEGVPYLYDRIKKMVIPDVVKYVQCGLLLDISLSINHYFVCSAFIFLEF